MPIHIADPTYPDSLVTFGGDNLVTDTGDNLVVASYGVVDLIEVVNVGAVTINKVYAGADLVHEHPVAQVLTLTSDTDVNLSTWLGTQGADAAKPIIINFASDQIIGGTEIGRASCRERV